jgi:hypothetical protein
MGFNKSNMKKSIILFLLVSIGKVCTAQTAEEWLKQKETQKKYLIQQMAALKVYLGYVRKGYSIAQKGLTAISDIKKGDFAVHRDFIHSLNDINPKIKGYAKVTGIMALQLKIMEVYKDIHKQTRTQILFTGEEVGYISNVFENLLNECSDIIVDLTAVVASNGLEMNDNERLKRIDALYTGMQEAYTLSQRFGTDIKLLSLQRMKERADLYTSRALNGIKNK